MPEIYRFVGKDESLSFDSKFCFHYSRDVDRRQGLCEYLASDGFWVRHCGKPCASGFLQNVRVDHVRGHLPFEERDNVGCCHDRHFCTRLDRGGSEMRGQNNVRTFQPRKNEWFVLVYIQCSPSDLLVFKRGNQSGFIHHWTA